jgi:hypothetical protein
MPDKPRKLLDQVRDAIRVKHYSYKTEQSYVEWVKRFILFHDKRHPSDMSEIINFLHSNSFGKAFDLSRSKMGPPMDSR